MKTVLVVGLGRFGRHMARKLIEEGNEVLAIDINEERADAAAEFIPNVQIGDTTNEAFIRSLGVNNFDLCVVAIGDNFQSALETTVLLKDLGGKYILARASRDVHKKLLLRNGADHVVYAEREMAERLAVKYGSKKIFDYIAMTKDYAIYEISLPAAWKGKNMVELEVRTKYHISILATKRGESIFPLPDPQSHLFTADETLVVFGHKDMVKALTK
ncbi:Ktr system potassium uptake protein A [uncultured Ruminococcus sp.]|uniref:TrkA family potassium uptake protein n=1 Tax=Massiliimalia timonensis TaxID=1987501 RepID=A0A8J6PFL7_9FIRM|nr:TrkA family potassium uptake protein [Massiliimalia timonensis]MBC8610862.1 TrkA family potassium uptake protein [Massiliimalia timonensis]SCI01439.1 Ktr system potassium uptake protein A [uncultured Clostridium sp.]SCI16891.1 Ktr system potassium uptake protein A [uncultured Ruminococcus sp.]